MHACTCTSCPLSPFFRDYNLFIWLPVYSNRLFYYNSYTVTVPNLTCVTYMYLYRSVLEHSYHSSTSQWFERGWFDPWPLLHGDGGPSWLRPQDLHRVLLPPDLGGMHACNTIDPQNKIYITHACTSIPLIYDVFPIELLVCYRGSAYLIYRGVFLHVYSYMYIHA